MLATESVDTTFEAGPTACHGPSDTTGSDPPSSRLGSVHTDSFASLLEQSGTSVAVTTYQAGSVVLFRHDGQALNTHFRAVKRPMGLATSGSHLAVGAAREVFHYENVADVTDRLEGPRPHDACYLPRHVHITGGIDVHEMAWAAPEVRDERSEVRGQKFGGERQRGEGQVRQGSDRRPSDGDQPSLTSNLSPLTSLPELWLVNTAFSCLCTLNNEHSFVPRWRPPFISSLSPQDRCHLNGLAMGDGRPRYVTALGDTDAPQGWRENKARGGVLIDVDSGETITRGLSMPHSPRWHDGRLWLLESGDGSIGTVDLATGRYEAVARVDGFTRGLSFLGPYALIGISQVRESAIFSGIPITERLDPDNRICGVSLVDLRSGREVGFVRFEGAVQEIFAVQLLPHRFPEMLEISSVLLGNSYALPDESLPDVKWLPTETPAPTGSKQHRPVPTQ